MNWKYDKKGKRVIPILGICVKMVAAHGKRVRILNLGFPEIQMRQGARSSFDESARVLSVDGYFGNVRTFDLKAQFIVSALND
jgi:hypothetical protein